MEADPGYRLVGQSHDALPVRLWDEESCGLVDEGNVGMKCDIGQGGQGQHILSQLPLPLALRVGHIDRVHALFIGGRPENGTSQNLETDRQTDRQRQRENTDSVIHCGTSAKVITLDLKIKINKNIYAARNTIQNSTTPKQ